MQDEKRTKEKVTNLTKLEAPLHGLFSERKKKKNKKNTFIPTL
jgi:hypothetical protein